VSRSGKYGLILSGLVLLFLKLYYDLYLGASDGLFPNIASDAINWAWPFYNHVKVSVQSGMLPTWNPFIALGAPVFPDLSMAMFYPINWIIYLIEVPEALLAIQFVTVMIGILCMYYYTRYLRLTWPARILCAVLFAYTLFTESFHPVIASSLCWFPLLLLLVHRYFDSPCLFNALPISIVLALTFLAGFINFFFYTCMILFVYCSILLIFSWSRSGLGGIASRVAMLVPALLLMLGLVAAQLIPTIEFTNLSVRSVSSGSAYRSESALENFSLVLMLKNYFQTNLAYIYANGFFRLPSGVYYLGGTLLLLPFAFFSKQYRIVSLALTASFIFIVLFMLSNQVSALAFLQKIPLASSMRIHGRAMAYAQVLLIILSGVGLSVLCQQVRQPLEAMSRSRALLGVASFLGYAALLAIFALSIPDNNWFLASAALCTLLIVIVLLRPAETSTALRCGWIIALVIVVDVSAHRNNRFLVPAFVNKEVPFVSSNIEQAREVSGQSRVLFVAGGEGKAYRVANMGPKYQVAHIGAYTPLSLARWENFIRYLGGEQEYDQVISQSLNMRFYGAFIPSLLNLLSKEPRILEMASLRYWFSPTGTVEHENALPRAYVVRHYLQTDDEAHSLAAIKENLAHIENTVILENASPTYSSLPAPTREHGEAVITLHSNDRVELDVEVANPSILVLTDAFYPGWRAYVDDRPTPLFRANSLFRAVEVPAGKHRVSFRFIPISLYWGLAISFISAAIIVALMFRHSDRGKARQRVCPVQPPTQAAYGGTTTRPG
jgi:hypothetical protein